MPTPKAKFTVVGTRARMVDALEKVSGRAKYADDYAVPPGTLYARVLRSPHAHARILKIDTSRASALPGVKAIITGDTLPPIPNENPADPVIARQKVTFENQGVAIVAAKDLPTCDQALDLIQVTYELLTPVFTAEDAIKPGAPNVLPQFPTNTDAGWLGDPIDLTRGDVERGFAEAELVLEDRYSVGLQVNASPEIRTIFAHWTDEGLLLRYPTQQLHWDRKVIAQALGLPLSRVRVINPFCGGGYGAANKSKGSDDCRILTSLLAKMTRHPVKLVFTRREELINGRGRHQNQAFVRLGVKKDGRITALDVRQYFNKGGSNEMGYVVAAYGTYSAMSLHGIPNVRFRTWEVITNTTPGEEFRAFGNVQSMFPIESLVDDAAYRLGIDPAEMRLKNHITAGFTWGAKRTNEIRSVKMSSADLTKSPNAIAKAVRAVYLSGIEPPSNPDQVIAGPKPLSSSALEQCIQTGMERIGWKQKWHPAGAGGNGPIKHGIGMTILLLPTGLFSTEAEIRVNIRGGVFVPHGAANIGTGPGNAIGQVVAEVLGVPFDNVKVHWGDTDTTPYDSMTAASRIAATACNAYAIAAEDAKRQILEAASAEMNTSADKLDMKGGRIFVIDNPKMGGPMEELLARQYDKEFIGRGYFRSEAQPLIPLNMGAGFVEVEVDTETGYVKLINAVAVTDCGVPINPDIVEGQIQGAFIMGASYALGDHLITDPSTGRIVNPDFYGYKVMLASDCPNIEPVIVDSWDPLGKVGQKGVGEAFLIAGPGAIGNAIYNAIGVRVKDLPFTPQKILTALGKL